MPSDQVRIICPNLKCRAVLCIPNHARGKTVRCRNCGMHVKIPAPKAPLPDAGAAATPTPTPAAEG